MAFGVTLPRVARPPSLTARRTSTRAVPAPSFAQQVHGRPPPSAPRPNTTGNQRAGQQFRVLPAPGGTWHLYPNGAKIFVKANAQPPQIQRGTPGQPAVDPGGMLNPDAEFFDERAAGLFKIRQQLDDNEQEGTANLLAKREALRELETQRPVDTRNQVNAGNKAGLFYSSALTGDLQNLAASYAQRTAGIETDFSTKEASRLAQRQAISAGDLLDEGASRERAAGRQVDRDTTAADAGYLVKEYGTPGTPDRTIPGKAAPPVRYKTTRDRLGREVHTYSTGRRVTLKGRRLSDRYRARL